MGELQKHGTFRSSRREGISFIVKAAHEPSPSSTGFLSQGVFFFVLLSVELEFTAIIIYVLHAFIATLLLSVSRTVLVSDLLIGILGTALLLFDS